MSDHSPQEAEMGVVGWKLRARVFLNNPPILILDEATSGLDSEVENLIHDAVRRLMKRRTSFLIAHRLASAVDAD